MSPPSQHPPCVRLLTIDDAPALADLVRANRAFLKPWEPQRDPTHFTVEGQRQALESALTRHAMFGTELPYAIVDQKGDLIGRITLSNIVRGPFQSSNVGYWVAESNTRHGFATTALREIMAIAFSEIGLHRLQAGTLVNNDGSRRVLEKAGFEQIGLARAYLRIDGAWRDHILYQALSP